MAGLYGFSCSDEEMAVRYPREAAGSLRFSADGSELAVINSLAEDDPLYGISDPGAELGWQEAADRVFYHVIAGTDAEAAATKIDLFRSRPYTGTRSRVKLFRRDGHGLYWYSDGEICGGMLGRQAEMAAEIFGTGHVDGPLFILPLKRYFYACPVCGRRSLVLRGWYDICTECGWEDEGCDDPDKAQDLNGNMSIRAYRAEYEKRKKECPGWTWAGQNEGCF